PELLLHVGRSTATPPRHDGSESGIVAGRKILQFDLIFHELKVERTACEQSALMQPPRGRLLLRLKPRHPNTHTVDVPTILAARLTGCPPRRTANARFGSRWRSPRWPSRARLRCRSARNRPQPLRWCFRGKHLPNALLRRT